MKNDKTSKSWTIGCYAGGLGIEERNDHADLIAAAPDLLASAYEAQEAILAFFDMVKMIQKFQALPIPAILDVAANNCPVILNHLQKAINKATKAER